MVGLKKSITRETETSIRKRPLVIELYPRFLVLREKGLKTGYVLHFDVAFDFARKLNVQRKKVKALPLLGEESRHQNLEKGTQQ